MASQNRIEAFGATTEHAAVELACLRAQRLQRMMAEVEAQLRCKVNDWMAVDLSGVADANVPKAWADQRGAGWLKNAAEPEVALMKRFCDALYAFRSPDVVARLQLLDALADAAALLEAQPPSPEPEEVRRRILAHAARMFELSQPEAAGRLSLVQWDAALVAWQRKGGRPRAGDSRETKWEAMVAFVVAAGLAKITAEGLAKDWQEWKRGLVTSSLDFGAEATDKSRHVSSSQAPANVGSGTGK